MEFDEAIATIVTVALISVVSMIGILFLRTVNEKRFALALLCFYVRLNVHIFVMYLINSRIHSTIDLMVALAVGSLLGGAFLHLLPEVSEELGFSRTVSTVGMLGAVPI